MSTKPALPSLQEEAATFDRRIEERTSAGFVPDLRRAVKCEHFYKSFWRDPHYIDLYLGDMLRTYLDLLGKYCPRGASILDVGCGAGYFSLELARHGYRVHAVDISAACIREARRVAADNPYTDGFGSLRYEVSEFGATSGQYDVVMFGGSLHHLVDLEASVAHAADLLAPGGHVLCYEPCHERWQKADAAQVALIRGLLALTGHWYSHEDDHLLNAATGLEILTQEVHDEFVFERDKNEPGGQSPHDNESDGRSILDALHRHFGETEVRPGFSFIYRVLGGLRGRDETTHAIAGLLAAYDRLCVTNGYMNPNGFFFIGRR